MLKFHLRLLLLISTITIISFIGLGAIIHNTIYQTLTSNQIKSLDSEARNYVNLFNNNKEKEITNIAHNEKNIILIKENDKDKIIYSSGNIKDIDHRIDNEANPSKLINKNTKLGMRYTYKNTIDDKTIYISGINNEIIDLQKDLWKYLSIVGVIVLFTVYLASRSINRTYIRPINEVTYATSLLADGYYHVRVPESNVKETRALFVTTNDLARRLQKLNNSQKIQSNRLKTTLENIPSSVLMIDKHGEIVVANHAYYQVFNPDQMVENKSYIGFIDDSIEKLIIESFRTEKVIYEQLEVDINNVHTKYFDVSCIPILTKGFAETLIEGAKNDEQSLDMFLNIILKESNRIESLVTDLLDLSHIEQQKELEINYMNLSELAINIIDNLQTQAQNKRIKIQSEIEKDVIIEAHENKIAQVITNLLSNAINYSSEDNKVIVRVYRNDNKVYLEIQDYGIGISETDQKRIFERFYRVDKARSRDSGGTGLGLSITKHIVEAHNGRIDVKSAPGKGSIFKVLFNDN